jgi:nucleotide-binding universal stress UspA family protein
VHAEFPRGSDGGAALLARFSGLAHHLDPDVAVETDLAVGSPVAVLIDRSRQAGLVVLGCRGRGSLTGALAGSVSVTVAAHARAPVMVVHRPEPHVDPSRRELPVVVGADGSASSDEAIRFAAREARLRGAPLVALRSRGRAVAHAGAVGRDPLGPDAPSRSTVDTATRSVRVETVDLAPEAALVGASAHACMIVVGSRGRGGVTGLLLGSVGQALIHHAHCPVVVVHASR